MDALDVIRIALLLFLVVVLFQVAYTLSLAWTARRYEQLIGKGLDGDGAPPFTVFLIPCLNEATVIGRCVERLVELPGDDYAVLVIDDGSEDGTGDVVRPYTDDKVWLLQRHAPHCQEGKGEALNAGLEHVRSRLSGRVDLDRVVACVIDADGDLQPDALEVADPLFAGGGYAGAQMLVRMENRADSLLARMQDFEFVVVGRIYQRARHVLGCPALGGNAQFTSLAALDQLEGLPWSKCLIEDLELSIRMSLAGRKLAYADQSSVEQQGLTSVHRLIRQRSRWFQGKLQCRKWIRPIVRSSRLTRRQKFDMVHDLFGTALIIQSSLMSVIFFGLVVTWAVIEPSNLTWWLTAYSGLFPITFYLLVFGLTPMYALAYARTDDDVGVFKALLYAHLYVIYEYHWAPAGWIANWRHLRGRSGWLKTEREQPVQPVRLSGH